MSDDGPRSSARREVLSAGVAAASSFVFGSVATRAYATVNADPLNLAALKTDFGFRGAVLTPSEPGFRAAAFGELWNKLQPARHPQAILQVGDEDDVVAAVKFALANKLKVTVRGGGHNWCSPSLRNGGILIDLVNLNKIVSIDPVARKAILQPIVSNREVQAALNPHGLSFPSGHCPTVKVSGYLLSGGMSWNHGVWGPGVGSVEAIELVNANGHLITASATENTDYFWAARGSGPGFFGVVVRYHLKLHPLPQAITASAYDYPFDQIVDIARWLEPLAGELPSNVELSLWAVQAPSELADKAKSSNGKVARVTATMFADSEESAGATLRMLDSYPGIDQCLSRSLARPTNFETLSDGSGALWPADLRCKVDAMFSNASLAEMMQAVKDHLLISPSPKTVFMWAVYTGKGRAPATPPDAAFSMTGNLYGGPWTMWDSPDRDAENIAWHEKCVRLLEPHIAGHYIAESDTVAHPEYVRKSYTPAAWERLTGLRRKHDPGGLFFNFSDGLN